MKIRHALLVSTMLAASSLAMAQAGGGGGGPAGNDPSGGTNAGTTREGVTRPIRFDREHDARATEPRQLDEQTANRPGAGDHHGVTRDDRRLIDAANATREWFNERGVSIERNQAKVTVDDVSAAAAQFLGPARFLGVVVGDAAQIAGPLAAVTSVITEL